MSEPLRQSDCVFDPRVTIAIIRSELDLALYEGAAEIAGGTTVNVLPNRPSVVDAFVADRDHSDFPGIDIRSRAQEALSSGAMMACVIEDREVRRRTPGNIWNYLPKRIFTQSNK